MTDTVNLPKEIDFIPILIVSKKTINTCYLLHCECNECQTQSLESGIETYLLLGSATP